MVIDRQGIIEERYGGDAVQVKWSDVHTVSWSDGRLYPLFVDDGMLEITGVDGDKVSVPVWVKDRGAVAAAIAASLPSTR